jgi:hypothetical protein
MAKASCLKRGIRREKKPGDKFFVSKKSPLLHIAALLLTAGFAWAAARLSNTGEDLDPSPEAQFETGLVRVWNESGEPPLERDHTPEAQLGDALVVELKNLDQWFAENLEAGAWQEDGAVKNAEPVVKELIRDHQLTAAIKVGRQLEELARANSALTRPRQAPPAEAEMTALTSSPELMEQVGYVVWGDYHPKDENGAALDVSNPVQVLVAIEQCAKALQLVRDLAGQETAKFVLTINDVPLPGLTVETPERETGWRLDEDPHDLELKRPAYSWYQFRLQGPHNSEFGKAWARLMQSAGTRFSNPSTVVLSVPGEKKPLATNVTPAAEDSRCRFNLLAVNLPTPTPGQRHFKNGDAVYPLDERDRENHVLKGRIVEDPDWRSDAPYLVHFEERGGTRRFAGTDLARLPPDLIPSGVVRVWNGNEPAITEWEDAQKDETPEARIGETLVVEVRNFGGWLARQIDNGSLQDEALILKATQASKPLDDLIKAKRFAATVRVGKKIQRILEAAPHTTATEMIEKLDRDKRNDPDLAALNFPKLTVEPTQKPAPVETPSAPVSAQTTPPAMKAATPGPETAAVKKDPLRNKQLGAQKEALRTKEEQEAQTFLAPFQAANSLVVELKAAKLRTLILTINDIPLGITPDNSDYAPVPKARRPAGDPKDDIYYWLHFSMRAKPVDVNEDGKKGQDPFKRLMEHPSFTMPSKVTLTLRTATDPLILPTAVTKNAEDVRSRFNLIGIEKFKFWPMAFVFMLILGSLAFFAASTDILRDPGRRRPEGVEPVSLARTQMAFWFVVIAAAFAFLWVTTGNIDTINGTCLTLLAIGTTTALTTMAVQGNRSGRKDLSDALQKTPHEMLKLGPAELRDAIAARKKELEETGASTMSPEELAEDTALLQTFGRRLDQFFKQRSKWCPLRVYYWRYRLRSVFEDLLTEEAGAYDFHRFQMLAWTLVLGSVFVFKVFADRTMPQFDSNLLLLMGISSGAYIGFKVASPRNSGGDPPREDETQKNAVPEPPAKPIDQSYSGR